MNEQDNDLISRQAAIDEANKDGAYGYISAAELAKLPSVTPTAKENLAVNAPTQKRAVNALDHVDDAISRKAALECFELTNTRPGARHAIENLPAIKPKTGRWIAYRVLLPDREVLNFKCSVCGRKLIGYNEFTLADAPYCHCGAYMMGGQE